MAGHLQLLGVLGNLGPVSLQLDLQLLQLPVQLPDNCNSEKDEKIILAMNIWLRTDLLPTKHAIDIDDYDSYVYL